MFKTPRISALSRLAKSARTGEGEATDTAPMESKARPSEKMREVNIMFEFEW